MEQKLCWIVKIFDINAQQIQDYDVLKYREDQIKKFKKQCATKEEFAEKLRREFQWQYWSRAEYEVIIRLTDDSRVVLLPWVGCCRAEEVAIDVTDDVSFDWLGFAKEHIGTQIFDNEAKVDIYDQIMWSWPQIVDYCWHTRCKYERDNPKFHKE